MFANDFTHFFFGGPRGRELEDTRRLWRETEKQYRKSPLAEHTPRDLAISVVQEVLASLRASPPMSVTMALQGVAEALFRAENLEPREADWHAIRTDVAAAISVRASLAHRSAWALRFDRYAAVSRRALREVFAALVHALPDSVLGTDAANGFEVPLSDFLADPAALVESIIALPFAPEVQQLSLFDPLREQLEHNLMAASGIREVDDLAAKAHRLVMPRAQKNQGAEYLSRVYLAGTPFEALLSIPIPFGIPETSRVEHCHIVGGTGHGKTQLMQQMIYADLLAAQTDKRSVVVIDSQGDLIAKLAHLDLFGEGKPLRDRLVIIDPTDVAHPAALNLFAAQTRRLGQYQLADKERVLNGIVELYEKFFGEFLGAELTQKQGVVFKYLARLMLTIPDASLHTLIDLMDNGRKYRPYMEQLDGAAKHFFAKEFFDPSFAATKKQIAKRLWGVLATPAFERMFLQKENKLDLFEALNAGKIILINTSKELLKQEGSALFGRFFVGMLTHAALERSTIPEHARNPAYVYMDEAHEYFDDSIETILNQARKYRVGLTLAHQSLDQLSLKLRATLLTNTSIKCVGGVSAKDASALADEVSTTPEFLRDMRRAGARTEFAVWVKHYTPRAIRLSVPLGFLERQPTMTNEEYERVLLKNRAKYCGTLADVSKPFVEVPEAPAVKATKEPEPRVTTGAAAPVATRPARALPDTPHDLGKGGAKHRYLQALVKELAEQIGLKATIEAPLPEGGAVDVLIERDGVVAAFEISVATPVAHERENLAKCLAAPIPKIAVVLAKSARAQATYRQELSAIIPDTDRDRVTFLTPEEIPEYVLSLAPPPGPQERVVKGYKVTSSVSTLSPEEVKARRETIGRLVAGALRKID